VAPFLEDRCELGPEFLVASADLYRAYVQWCEENAVQPVSRRAFSEQLQTRQCVPERTAAALLWKGLRLRHDVHASHRGGEEPPQNDFDWTDA
jgi:phage/plasmid-associated DNA primase